MLPDSIHLAVAGSGSLRQPLQELTNSLGLNSRIHFLGHINHMESFYPALDVFCLPSLNEGFPLAPLEAQSCGIPTLVTRVGGAQETLCPTTGTIVEKKSPPQLAKALLKILNTDNSTSPRHFVTQFRDVRKMAHAYSSIRNNT